MAFKKNAQPDFKSEDERSLTRKRRFLYFMCAAINLVCLLLDIYFVMAIIDKLS